MQSAQRARVDVRVAVQGGVDPEEAQRIPPMPKAKKDEAGEGELAGKRKAKKSKDAKPSVEL